jgi:hypothetical protein
MKGKKIGGGAYGRAYISQHTEKADTFVAVKHIIAENEKEHNDA